MIQCAICFFIYIFKCFLGFKSNHSIYLNIIPQASCYFYDCNIQCILISFIVTLFISIIFLSSIIQNLHSNILMLVFSYNSWYCFCQLAHKYNWDLYWNMLNSYFTRNATGIFTILSIVLKDDLPGKFLRKIIYKVLHVILEHFESLFWNVFIFVISMCKVF